MVPGQQSDPGMGNNCAMAMIDGPRFSVCGSPVPGRCQKLPHMVGAGPESMGIGAGKRSPEPVRGLNAGWRSISHPADTSKHANVLPPCGG